MATDVRQREIVRFFMVVEIQPMVVQVFLWVDGRRRDCSTGYLHHSKLSLTTAQKHRRETVYTYIHWLVNNTSLILPVVENTVNTISRISQYFECQGA